MAIVIHDEEQKKSSWFGFTVVFVVVLMIGIAAYYVFFVQPAVINQVAPLELQSLDSIRALQFDPQTVVTNPLFAHDQSSIPPPQVPVGSNAQPFGIF